MVAGTLLSKMKRRMRKEKNGRNRSLRKMDLALVSLVLRCRLFCCTFDGLVDAFAFADTEVQLREYAHIYKTRNTIDVDVSLGQKSVTFGAI